MVIQNNGDVVDRLLGGTSTVAEKVEVHAHIHKDGQMTMQHLADGLEIAPGKTAKFVPGELHLMLIGLKKPLVEGENFPVTLEFEQAGSVDVIVNIEQGQAGMKHGTSDNSEHMGHSAETKTVE